MRQLLPGGMAVPTACRSRLKSQDQWADARQAGEASRAFDTGPQGL